MIVNFVQFEIAVFIILWTRHVALQHT